MNISEEEITTLQEVLSKILPDAVLVMQDWDNRVDCLLRLPDGTVLGEMISFEELDAARIQESGDRLKMRLCGQEVQLVNEIVQPSRMVVTEDPGTSKTATNAKDR